MNKYKMVYIYDVNDIFKYTNVNNIDTVYINIDNIVRITKLLPKVYSKVPSLRTNIITKIKSFSLNDNHMYEKIYDLCKKNNNAQIYAITNNDLNNFLPENIDAINANNVAEHINKINASCVIVDIFDHYSNNIINKNNVTFMMYGII